MAMLISGQVPHRSNSSQLFWNGLLHQKSKQTGEGRSSWGHTFLKKTLNFFCFFFCTSGNSSKAKLHPWKFGKIMYVTSLENFKARTKNENYLQPVTLTGWLFPLTDFNAGFWAQYVAFTSSSASDITLNSCTNELPLRYQWQLSWCWAEQKISIWHWSKQNIVRFTHVKNEGRETWHTVFTTYISKRSIGTVWQ